MKCHIKKMKRQATDWEKDTCKAHIHQRTKLNSKKQNPIRNLAKYLKTHFTEQDIKMARRHMKTCLISLTIREMQIKTTVRYYYTFNQWLT